MARSHYDLEDELRQKNRELRDLRELREQIRKMSEEERHLLREIELLTTEQKAQTLAACRVLLTVKRLASESMGGVQAKVMTFVEGHPSEMHATADAFVPLTTVPWDIARVRAGAVMHRYSLEQRVPWAVRKAFFRYAKDMLANILPRLMWKAMAEGQQTVKALRIDEQVEQQRRV